MRPRCCCCFCCCSLLLLLLLLLSMWVWMCSTFIFSEGAQGAMNFCAFTFSFALTIFRPGIVGVIFPFRAPYNPFDYVPRPCFFFPFFRTGPAAPKQKKLGKYSRSSCAAHPLLLYPLRGQILKAPCFTLQHHTLVCVCVDRFSKLDYTPHATMRLLLTCNERCRKVYLP